MLLDKSIGHESDCRPRAAVVSPVTVLGMNPDLAVVVTILVGAVVLFVSDKVRLDAVALLVVLALALSGVVTPAEALSGFADPLVALIAGLFVVSAVLVHTGIAGVDKTFPAKPDYEAADLKAAFELIRTQFPAPGKV